MPALLQRQTTEPTFQLQLVRAFGCEWSRVDCVLHSRSDILEVPSSNRIEKWRVDTIFSFVSSWPRAGVRFGRALAICCPQLLPLKQFALGFTSPWCVGQGTGRQRIAVQDSEGACLCSRPRSGPMHLCGRGAQTELAGFLVFAACFEMPACPCFSRCTIQAGGPSPAHT